MSDRNPSMWLGCQQMWFTLLLLLWQDLWNRIQVCRHACLLSIQFMIQAIAISDYCFRPIIHNIDKEILQLSELQS